MTISHDPIPSTESRSAPASTASRGSHDASPCSTHPPTSAAEIDLLKSGLHGNPFGLLGPQAVDGATVLRVWRPGADRADVIATQTGDVVASLACTDADGFFEGTLPDGLAPDGYRLRFGRGADQWVEEDPYRFPSSFGPVDLYLLAEGNEQQYHHKLGAHPIEIGGVAGTRFSVWAPNARRVSVVGSFNDWDGRRHLMRLHPGSGIWEVFVPGAAIGDLYKYEILGHDGVALKADPVAFRTERPPLTASVVNGVPTFDWTDAAWMKQRREQSAYHAPMSTYEVHLESWRRHPDGRSYTYDELADTLIPYVRDMGFTHIECMPLSEYPFGGSWGYQTTALFAPTSRFGTPEEFARFVDRCHAAGIGVIVDFVPAHFPSDAHGLARFDGTALYEHEDPRLGFHRDWNTLIYNFGRTEVRNFLVAAARYWLEVFHIDGLRVDAVASMLYLDYSRPADQWIPNRYGGNHNLEAIDFLRRMNTECYGSYPGSMTIAEESTAFSGVSRPVDTGGLGFGFKWNMGWMHDSLAYMGQDPIHRKYHHDQITFGLHYAYSENFVLPLSHDEVVHGKGSLIARMPGDTWQKFANLRAYFSFMWTHPGKKLLFMGGEFAQYAEWNHDRELDWSTLGSPRHAGVQRLVRDLNALYRTEPALHELDHVPDGFEWIDAQDRDASVFVYQRNGLDGTRPVVVVVNFTPTVRHGYRIGLPSGGRWTELFNSDAQCYDGSGVGNGGGFDAETTGWQGRSCSASITLPPLATIVLAPA